MKNQLISIKRIRTINGPELVVSAFPREITKLDIEDLLEPNLDLGVLLQKIQMLVPHSLVIKQATGSHKTYMFMEFEVELQECSLLRKSLLIASGSHNEMKEEFLNKIQKEYPGKFKNINISEVDNEWIRNFCLMHYDDPKMFRIISTN